MSGQGSLEQRDARRPHDWKRTRRIARGIVILAATAYGGVISGKFLGEMIQDADVKFVLGVPLSWGVAGIGLTYILTSIEKLFDLLKSLWDYVMQPDLEVSLFPGCVTLACLIAYLAALPSIFSASSESERAAVAAASVREVVYLSRAPEKESRTVEAFPFQFELARGRDGWRGTQLANEQDAALVRLVGSLKACVGSNSGENVEIQVQGFADANEFPSSNEEFNLQTANRRAANLHQRIVAIAGKQNTKARLIVRDPVQWSSLKQMTEHPRYFRVRPLRQTGRGYDQGLLNRRAEILLLRAGMCERLVAK